jgi:hypothetical protein
MHRKLIYGLFICMFTFLATNASAQYWGDAGPFEFTGDAGVITITGYNGGGGAIVIPDTVLGFPVVAIGSNAFRENTDITGVTIPEGVISIGASALRDCTGLTSVTLPDSLEEIGSSAFYRCTGLTNVTIPELVTVINSSVFSGCTGLTSVTLPDNATEIGSSAFSTTGLTSITIPDKVTKISSSFKNCAALTSVNIPALVASLSTAAFDNCTSLTSINVDAANDAFTSMDGVVYDNSTETLLIYPTAKAGAFSIPDGVTTIKKQSFTHTTAITDVTIPESVTLIDKQAFYLASITSVIVPASASVIKVQAFRACPNLTSITVDPGNEVYSSVDGVLYGDNETTLLQYPSGLPGAFTVPSSVTTIPAHAFSNSSVLTSVTFPDTVTSINSSCAVATPSMTSFIVDTFNEVYSSLDGVIYGDNETTLLLAPKGISGHFDIPNTVTTLADSSFGGCELLTSVTIPDSVTTLAGGWASGPFTRSGLTSVIIPDSVTDIAGPSFYGCVDLTSMHIGSGATNIGSGLAWECTSLETITVAPANASFTSIDGVMYDKLATRLMYFPLARAGAFTVPDGVISIDSSALRAAHLITEITLPGSVTTLGNYCFAPMNSLETVNMVEGLEKIGRGSLRYAPNLTEVTIPASVTEIVKDAFLNNWRMSSAYFLGNAPVMGTNVFSGNAADFHICYPDDAFGFTRPWFGYRAYPVSICDNPFGDLDGDTIENYLDNCVNIPNLDQADADIDYIGDICDNCPDFAGNNQRDVDDDGEGDICDDGTIYGTISGAGVSNIAVQLHQVTCGASSHEATYVTGDDGYYAFADRADTVYEIIPVMWLYTFIPESVRVDTFYYPANNMFDFTSESAF